MAMTMFPFMIYVDDYEYLHGYEYDHVYDHAYVRNMIIIRFCFWFMLKILFKFLHMTLITIITIIEHALLLEGRRV